MKSKYLFIIFLLINCLYSAQVVTFKSKNTGNVLSQVHVFNIEGKLLAISNIDGQINLEEINKNEGELTLVYDYYKIGTITHTDLKKSEILLNDKIQEIDEIEFTVNTKNKYLYLRGYFNTYLNLNKELNVYTDGIITYVFDTKSKKIKNTALEQYRVFTKERGNSGRKVSDMVFTSMLKLPDAKNAGLITEESKSKYKEVLSGDLIKRQLRQTSLQDKEMKLFGYRFFDLTGIDTYTYNDIAQIKNLNSYNQHFSIKLKHKTELEYNILDYYTNFVVIDIKSGDENNFPKVKFKENKSYYNHEYWKMKKFPSMLSIFKEYHKDTLIEMPNSNKK